MLMLACRPSVQPDLPEGLAAALLVGPGREVNAVEGDQRATQTISGESGEPLLFGYRSSLDELFLQPGRLEVLAPPAGRPLPLADWYLMLERSDEGLSWADSPSALESTASLRLPTVSAAACASAGGCYPSFAASRVEDCRRSCAPSDPTSPVPPEAPLPPTFAACPPEWSTAPGGVSCTRGRGHVFAGRVAGVWGGGL